MLSGTTPFKIHDENAGAVGAVKSSMKGGGGMGLGNATAKKKVVMADGMISNSKTPMLSKSSRKALGAISVNKQMGREDAAGPLQEDSKSRLIMAPMSTKKAGSGNLPDVSSMICSQVRKEEDAYDVTMKKASELKTVLVPSTSIDRQPQVSQDENDESAWNAGISSAEDVVDVDCAALSMGKDDNGSYAFTLGPSEEDW